MFRPEVLAYRKAHNGANPVITHHTADRRNDILSSVRGKMMCSTQQAAMERSHESDEYQAFINSEESARMRQLIDDELEPEGVLFGGLDCLMTSICTDRSIPDVINDYKSEKIDKNDAGDDDDNNQYTKKYGPNRFERLSDYVRLSYYIILYYYFCFVALSPRRVYTLNVATIHSLTLLFYYCFSNNA